MRLIIQFIAINLLLCLWVTSSLFAASERLSIEYPSAAWNLSPSKFDTAYLFVRRSEGGRFVKVIVSETAPDSSVFQGKFSIEFTAEESAELGSLQVFIPPLDARGNTDSVQEFSRLVQTGKIIASPILIQEDSGSFDISVYDTEQQLNLAKEIIERERVAKELAKKARQANQVNEQNVSSKISSLADRANQIASAATEATLQETKRLKKAQLEAQKRELQKQKILEMKELDKEKFKLKAEQYSQKGQLAYQQGKYRLAEALFRKATELDPSDDNFYFMYGVSLYRNEKLNEALIILKLADNEPENAIERQYYMGLIHYRLNEHGPASDYFRTVKEANIDVLSASAAFYRGLALMGLDQLPDAQREFEWVIDNSSDAQLDQRAEEYIEKIANLINYRKRIARKWSANLKAGLNYDSNILLSSDITNQSAAIASDKGGLRFLGIGGVGRQLLVRDNLSWEAKLDSIYMYSIDDTFNRADPWQTTAALTYNQNGALKDKQAYALSIEPYVVSLFMDTEDEGSRQNILNSIGIKPEFTIIKRKDYFVQYGGFIQKDNSNLEVTSSAENSDALLLNISNTHTVFLDSAKKRALIGSVQLWYNKADGENKSFQRIQGEATYVSPYKKWKNSIWTAGLSFYKLRFPDGSDGRSDTNISLTGTLTKPINETWSMTGVGSYTNNASNVSDNQYSKYSMMLLANYTWLQ